MNIHSKIVNILEDHFWLDTIDDRTAYSRTQDDTDGDPTNGVLRVMFSQDGDAWISINGHSLIRFRTQNGGGRSPRTRTALLILAEAIRLDTENDGQMRLF